MRCTEVRAAFRMLSVIKAAKAKNVLIPNEKEIDERESPTAQV